MNFFNRMAVVVLSIAVIVVGLSVASVPDSILAFLQYWTLDAVVTPEDRLVSGILGAALAIVGSAILYLELRPQPSKTVVVSRLNDGVAALEVSSIAQRIRQQVEAVEGVAQAIPHVTGRGRSADVRLSVLASTEVDVPAKAGEIGETVRSCVEKMGISLGRQQINLRYVPDQPKMAPRT